MFLVADIQKNQQFQEDFEEVQIEERQNNHDDDSDLDESFLEQISQNHLREQNKEDANKQLVDNSQTKIDNTQKLTQDKLNHTNRRADTSIFQALTLKIGKKISTLVSHPFLFELEEKLNFRSESCIFQKESSTTIKGFIISIILLLISCLYQLEIIKTVIILTALIIFCLFQKRISLRVLNYLASVLQLPQEGFSKWSNSIFSVNENIYLQFKKSLTFIRETELLLNRMRLGTPSQIIQKFERIADIQLNQSIDQQLNDQNSELENMLHSSYKNQLVQFQFSCINLRTQIVELLIEVIGKYINFLNMVYFLKKSQSLKIKCKIFENQIKKKSIQIENISNLWNTFCDIVEYSKKQFNEELFDYYLFILISQMKKIQKSKNALEKSFQFLLKQEMLTFQESDEVKKVNQDQEKIQLLPVLKQKYSRESQKYKLTLKTLVNCTREIINSDKLLIEQIQTKNCNELQGENSENNNQKLISGNVNNQKQNNHTVFLNNNQDWLFQLRDQLNLQMQTMIQINEQIQQEIDSKLGLVNCKIQQQSQSATQVEDEQNQEEESIFENANDKQIQNDSSNTKDIIKVFEANAYVDDSTGNQQLGFNFGKSLRSNRIENQVDFLDEMRQVLQQKQKKPVVEQKIILDSEEERLNYEKNKINMQDIAQQRIQFQQANKISLLSELKFVMNK
ncbi:hypothetical protein ABPG74_008605 [Tetrahymena malaccensis]